MIDHLQMGTGHMLLDRSLHCKVGWMSEMCFCMVFSSQTSVVLWIILFPLAPGWLRAWSICQSLTPSAPRNGDIKGSTAWEGWFWTLACTEGREGLNPQPEPGVEGFRQEAWVQWFSGLVEKGTRERTIQSISRCPTAVTTAGPVIAMQSCGWGTGWSAGLTAGFCAWWREGWSVSCFSSGLPAVVLSQRRLARVHQMGWRGKTALLDKPLFAALLWDYKGSCLLPWKTTWFSLQNL